MKFYLQTILLLCFLFLSLNQELNLVADKDYYKLELTKVEKLEKEKEVLELLTKLEAEKVKFKTLSTTKKVKEKFEENAKTLFANIMIKYVLPVTIPNVICGKSCGKKGREFIEYVTDEFFDGIKTVFEKYDKSSSFQDNKKDDYTDVILDKTKKILSKFPYANDLILSFTNLAWSCYELYYTFQETSKIGLYEEELEELKNEIDQIDTDNYFEFKLEDDYDTIKEILNKKIKELQKIQKKLEELIVKIETSIEILKYQRDKSSLSLFTGGISLFGMLRTIFTGVPVITLISTLLSLNVNLADLVMAENGIKKLKLILKEAKKTKEVFEKKIDELIKKTKDKLNQKKEINT